MVPIEISAQATTALAVAYLASLVESVEALTVVLAVGSVRGWRHAIAGAAAGAALIAAVTAIFGGALSRLPLSDLQLAIGVLLLLFGMRWLHKAVLRAAGIVPIHDESRIYLRESEKMRGRAPSLVGGFDMAGVTAAFNAVLLEGLEVVFIVIAAGVGGTMLAAGVGAVAAVLSVVALGLMLHRPLTRVPENTLKFIVGVLISSFGIFWVGEGMGFLWPGGERALIALIAAILAVAVICIWLARSSAEIASARG